MQSNNVLLARRSSQKNISLCQHGKQANQRGGYACIVKKRENGNAHTATENCQRNNFPITATCAPAAARMAGKRVMLAVPLSCKRLSVSRLPDPAYNVYNLCAKGFACAKFCAKRGNQLPRTCALKRRKPPLQSICQKPQKRTRKDAKKEQIPHYERMSVQLAAKLQNPP